MPYIIPHMMLIELNLFLTRNIPLREWRISFVWLDKTTFWACYQNSAGTKQKKQKLCNCWIWHKLKIRLHLWHCGRIVVELYLHYPCCFCLCNHILSWPLLIIWALIDGLPAVLFAHLYFHTHSVLSSSVFYPSVCSLLIEPMTMKKCKKNLYIVYNDQSVFCYLPWGQKAWLVWSFLFVWILSFWEILLTAVTLCWRITDSRMAFMSY